MSDTNFYFAFKERHRGSRELIKNRLRVYLPFILPLKQTYDDCSVIDLGCGRGEWLELASEAGFKSHGVDVNDRMLKTCRERGLTVSKQDAIDALKAITDESQVVVSAFHFVEHISFNNLQTLVKEALRVLKPAGLLILETQNPENITVGATNFYLDPTHQRPIPPQLLSFLPEYYGFSRVKILRLQEPSGLSEKKYLTLLDVIEGVSPDYAVIAQKNTDGEKLVLFDDLFKKDYGLTIGSLAARYEVDELRAQATMQTEAFTKAVSVWGDAYAALSHGLAKSEQEKTQLLARQKQIQEKVEKIESTICQYEHELSSARMKINELNGHVHYWWTMVDNSNKELQTVYASRSWRITAPLSLINRSTRWFMGGARVWLTLKPGSRPRRIAKKIIRYIIRAFEARPDLKWRVISIAHKLGAYPALKNLWVALQNTSTQAEAPAGHIFDHIAPPPSSDKNRPLSLLVFDGVNAQQRTPLETHFYIYEKQK